MLWQKQYMNNEMRWQQNVYRHMASCLSHIYATFMQGTIEGQDNFELILV